VLIASVSEKSDPAGTEVAVVTLRPNTTELDIFVVLPLMTW